MSLKELLSLADQLTGLDTLVSALRDSPSPTIAQIEGLAGTAKGYLLAHLTTALQRPILLITYQQEQAQRLADDLLHFGLPSESVAVLPASPSLFTPDDVVDHHLIGERLSALKLLGQNRPCVVIGVIEAILRRTIPPAYLQQESLRLEAETEVDLDTILHRLVKLGYLPTLTVTQPGEFSRRGGILDIYPSTAEAPIRIELFGDTIDSIRAFDVTTQRSIRREAWAEIAPAREAVLEPQRIVEALHRIKTRLETRRAELLAQKTREATKAAERLTELVEADLVALEQGTGFNSLERYITYIVPETICALDHLPPDGMVVLDEPHQVQEHWLRHDADLRSARERHYERGELLDLEPPILPLEEGYARLQQHRLLLLTLLARHVEPFTPLCFLQVHSAAMESYRGRLSLLADEIGTWLTNECRVVIASDQPQRVREICAELHLPVQPKEQTPLNPGLYVQEGRLRAGFKFTDLKLYVLTDAELFGAARPVRSHRKVAGGVAISSLLDLRENDYVVHIHHGIGIYRGLVRRQIDGTERDFLFIEYAGGDKLYVPADQIDRIQRYIGADGAPPQINRIGGGDWQRTKRKVREQAKQMAAELLRLYAAREAATRPPFGPDTPWQIEMEEAFPYEETPGQLQAIQEVKADLERERPMDRLICGDVGFGKTEVAIRAAFKVVSAGKQVAILCPTTVLAAQHHATFSERLAAYPITIELLSRFRTRAEQRKTVEGLRTGSVDIVVATHRLLSKDVEFKDLGLLIIDEEQRFGVAQKERLKKLRTSVDVLTLTATPIPRTLSMALSGLRDMSLIEDPPEGRMPVITYVREYDDELVRDAILRELERDGQVYFVHNRVESIYHVAQHLKKLIPDMRIEVGHGQMSEEELEQVMFDFYHHKADVLLCTTIIENGLDIPNCNTILIDNADHMGLAQLYQLRGRVGRSNRQAYAYLLYRPNKVLREDAEQRLAAIREFCALGSGYKVALRDLEIRGAGNLLGAEQSGAMLSVGFDLYCQLLSQAVQELRGEEPIEDMLPAVDLPVTAYIPESYIPGEAERIYFYKRLSGARTLKDIENLQAELEDRFGDPPRPVWEALAILRIRLRCKEIGIASIKGDRSGLTIRFAPHVRLTPEAIRLLNHAFKGHRFTSEGVILPLTSHKVREQVEEMIEVLDKALAYGKKPEMASLPTQR
ncbi:transcription-repair coupling factor [Chthonomonas calidirosea]|uniref:transcription-repair coupling factor n=1 Tax=Chthonomonas calidirosea TaxID=454171 RepID=UPI0006DD4A03|nr:transcription-repair coupling factor [Chthonomonas calidirosea]CEK19727.1 transcription-repair coupling factor [Chthonomonas calidirosea]